MSKPTTRRGFFSRSRARKAKEEREQRVADVIARLEIEGPEDVLPDEVIRVLTEDGLSKPRASWRPVSVDPFADDAAPRVRARELALELEADAQGGNND